jgi:hypothetical protein
MSATWSTYCGFDGNHQACGDCACSCHSRNASALPAWQQAEAEHDIAREHARTARLAKRETRFWPPMFGLILTAGITLAAAIQGGALHV